MKKVLIGIVFGFIIFGFKMDVYAITTDGNNDDESLYKITAYDVDVIVNEDNSYNITETIDAFFNEQQHGLIRQIPIYNQVVSNHGTYNTKAKISHLFVNDEFQTTKETDNYMIQIGSANQLILGPKQYTISYIYSLGNDKLKGIDEFYFNLIGNYWKTSIDNVSFSITFPKPFDTSQIGFSSGADGNVGTSSIQYQVDGNVVSGTYQGTLAPYEGISMRVELADGYFTNTTLSITLKKNLLIVQQFIQKILNKIVIQFTPSTFSIFVIFLFYFLFLSFFIYLSKIGKHIVTPVTFRPPDGLNSLLVGYIYKKGNVSAKDVAGLLLDLANDGYIQIYRSRFYKLRIKKIKDYDGTDELKKTFFSGLFFSSDISSINLSVLKITLSGTLEKILHILNGPSMRDLVFDKRSLSLLQLSYFLLPLLVIALLYIPFSLSGQLLNVTNSFILFCLLEIFVLYSSQYFAGISFFVFLILLYYGGNYHLNLLLNGNQMFDLVFFVCYILAFSVLPFLKKLHHRILQPSDQFEKVYGEILAFRRYLKYVKKEELEAKNSDLRYFYDVIPYAHVLNVSKRFMKQICDFDYVSPQWYINDSCMNWNSFYNDVNDSLYTAKRGLQRRTIFLSKNFHHISSANYDSSSDNCATSKGSCSGGGTGGGGGSSW